MNDLKGYKNNNLWLKPFKITAIYLLAGIFWIIFSDRILLEFGKDPETLNRMQTYKGIFFIFASGSILYIATYYISNSFRHSMERLIKSEASLANSQRIACVGNWDWDIVKNELYWSDEIYRIFGIDRHEFGATYEAFLNSVHQDDRDFVKKSVDEALYERKPYAIDHRIILPDGAERTVHEHAEVIFDDNGKSVRMSGTVQDITDHARLEFELKKLSSVVEQSANVIFITDTNGNIGYINPMFEQVTGWSKEEVIGKTPCILASGETTMEEYKILWDTILSGKTWRGIFKNKKKNGAPYWSNSVISPIMDKNGKITHFFTVQEDITEKVNAKKVVEHLESYDDLTNLLNRSRFMHVLSEWIYCNTDKQGILLLVDIDGLKLVNDSYGHVIGDELIRRMAGLLQKNRSRISSDFFIAGRLGGDEFAVFLPYLSAKDGIDAAELIRKEAEVLRLTNLPVQITVSIGIVSFPEHGTTTKELFTKADAALFHAQESGRNRCRLYLPEDKYLENIHSKLNEKIKIQNAIRDGRFVPWFQPILCLKDGMVRHYEALARMIDEDGGILSPNVFIDTAERFGLIGTIDRIITEKVIKLQAEMRSKGRDISFGMNLSGKELGDEELLLFLKSRILETGADPSRLIFEITETAAVHDMDRAVKFINSLKSIGCKFSLDDFGVGFTSFVYLREMHVDYIKIDGFFIKRLHENTNDQIFVKAITDVARPMGIKTVAEFVEKEEVIELLKQYGVDYAQGYAIGKPSPDIV